MDTVEMVFAHVFQNGQVKIAHI